MSQQQRDEANDALAILEYSLIQSIEQYAQHPNPELLTYDEWTINGSRLEFYTAAEVEQVAGGKAMIFICDEGMITGVRTIEAFISAGGSIVGLDEERERMVGFYRMTQSQAEALQEQYLIGTYRWQNARYWFCRSASGFISDQIA